jgi:Ca-activated chloride channel family protein
MAKLMRCPYCGLLQDEPVGVKNCSRCGGGLEYENPPLHGKGSSYVQVQMELDQVAAPAGHNVERYLLLTIRTPDKVPAKEAAPAGKKRPALSFTPVLDISGSMGGEKITDAKEAVRQAVGRLHADDVFSLVTFSDDVKCPFNPIEVDDQLIAQVENSLQEITAGGQTALCAGLEMGIKNAAKHKKESNLVLLLSDGQANVGETDLEKIGMRAQHAREQGLLVSTIGVGLDYNEALMTEVATQGGGRFYHIQDANKIPAFVAGELGEVAALAARDVTITLTLPNGATLIPLSATYPINQAGEQAVVSVGDIPCGTELEIPLRLALLAQPVGAKLSLDGMLEFQSPAGHMITIPINRVTVRFLKSDAFQLRVGMVLPVAEKVFSQMKANSVLGVSRIRALRPTQAKKQTETILASLEAYGELLGEDRVKEEMKLIKEEFILSEASAAFAKQSVNSANRVVRSSKDFNK